MIKWKKKRKKESEMVQKDKESKKKDCVVYCGGKKKVLGVGMGSQLPSPVENLPMKLLITVVKI